MLTVSDIENIRFGRAKVRGYKTEDVDEFIDEVKKSYEKLQNDNAELVTKIKILAQRVNEYRAQEESVRNALIKAQKIEDDSQREAKAKADDIIKRAKIEAESIIFNSQKEISQQQETLANLKKSIKEFRTNILNMYKEHLKLINSFNADERISEKELERLYSKKNSDKPNEDFEKSENSKHETFENKKSEDKNDSTQILEIVDISDRTSKKKFKDLKFGENYDVKSDTESPIGLFSKSSRS